MAAVTISSSFNFDDRVFDQLNPGEAITINNGATLTIDSDCISTTSSWGGPQNCNLASITINDGTFLVDATRTRIVTFIGLSGSYGTGSTAVYQGSVTASDAVQGITGSQTATGSIIALYPGHPSVSASGSLKFRSLSGTITSGSVLTLNSGSTTSWATASIQDDVGWLVISFIEAANITTTRQANFIVTGSWYTIGTGSGLNNQAFDGYVGRFCNNNTHFNNLFQTPSSSISGTVAQTSSLQGAIPAMWVETASGSNVYKPWVNVGNINPVFMLYPQATSSLAPTREDSRGYQFIHPNIGRFITASFSGSLATAGRQGYAIQSGSKVRLPNIQFIAGTLPSKNTSSINATITTWPKFVTTAAGTLNITNALGSAFYLALSQPYDVTLKDSGFSSQASITEVGNNLIMDNVAIGRVQQQLPASCLILTANYGSTNISNCNFIASVASANSATAGQNLVITSCKNVVITGSYISAWGKTGANAVGMSVLNTDNLTIADCQIVGAMTTVALLSSNINLTRNSNIAMFSGSFEVAALQSAWTFTNTSDIIIDNELSPFNGASAPFGGSFSFTSCTAIELKNIGSPTVPFNNFRQGETGSTDRPHGAYPLQLLNFNIDTKMSRCYFTGSRLGFINVNNSNDTLFLQNCNSDFTNSLQLAARNVKARGLRVGNAQLGTITIAQPGGIATGSTLAAVYGTHFYDDFKDNVTGSIGILATEQTTNAYSSGSYEVSASTNSITGSPVFNSNGALLMRESGSSVTWTWPWYIKGHAGFFNTGSQVGVINPTAFRHFYDIDYGSGFSGTFLTASLPNLITSSALITSASGFKFKYKLICAISSASNEFRGINFFTTTSAALQQTSSLYPITSLAAALTLTDLQTGSEIRVYNAGTVTELTGIESSSNVFSYPYVWEGTDLSVDIAILNLNYQYLRYTALSLGSAGVTVPIQQQFDRNYLNPTG